MTSNKFMTIPLETERLYLRPLREEFAAEAFAAWTTDPDVARYTNWSPHTSVEDTIAWLSEASKVIDSRINTIGVFSLRIPAN